MIKNIKTSFFFLLLSTFSLSSQELVELKINLQEGDKYKVFMPMTMDMDITMSMDNKSILDVIPEAGNLATASSKSLKNKEKNKSKENSASKTAAENFRLKMKMGTYYRFKVIEFVDGVYNLQVTFDRVVVMVEVEDSFMVMDTQLEPKGMDKELTDNWKTLQKIIGQEFYMEVSSIGDIQKIRNYDKILQIINNGKSQHETDEEEGEFYAFEYLSIDKLKSSWQYVFKIYPQQPVSLGESWVIDSYDEDKYAPMKSTDTYTLKEITDDYFVIEYQSVITDYVLDEANLTPVNINGSASGTINLSRTDNFQQIHPFKIEIDMNMSFMGLTMGSKTVGQDTLKVEKIN